MAIEMLARGFGSFMITETNADFGDCLGFVHLRYCDLPGAEYMAGVARSYIGKDGAGYVPLEISLEDLGKRAEELGYGVEGISCSMPDGRTAIYRLTRVDDVGQEISCFSVFALQGGLWVTNSACRRFFETVMGVEAHFFQEKGAWK